MRSESSRRLGEAVAFSAFYVAFYLCRYGVLPMAPLMAHEWGVGYGELGASISLMYAGYLASLVAAGLVVPALGPARALALSSSLTAAVNAALALARGRCLPQLLLVNGLAQGLAWPSLTQLAASRKGRAYYLVGSMLTAAALAPTLVFGAASAFMKFADWPLFFPTSAALMAAAALLFLPTHARACASGSRAGWRGARDALRSLDVWMLGLAYFSCYALVRGLLSWLPSLLVELEGVAPPSAAAACGLVSAAMAASEVVGAIVARRAASPWALITASFALSLAALTAGAALGPSPALVALCLVALSLSEWMYFATPAEALPQSAVPAASGLVDALGYLGGSIATWLLSASVTLGYGYLLAVASAFSGLGLALSLTRLWLARAPALKLRRAA
ncbi:MAG: hypothetical protein DRJ56_01700 [Thermoprotei archaeon]|nr:MAG: hypothetical protein DRJ56_01700 [Thermoprotei archaeon]